MKQLQIAVFLGGLAACACSAKEDFKPSPPFENDEDVKTWATASSAVSVYSRAYTPIAVADGKQTYEDAACPALSDDGTTLTITGDCVDDVGHDWKGSATVARDGDDRTLTLSDFEGDKGSLSSHLTSAGLHEFVAHLVLGGVTTVDYMGSVSGDYGAQTIWNGSGTVKRDGFISPNGSVDATTLDEVVDDSVCAGQPVSGSTTLKSGNDTAVITYDGETDCDSKQNAKLSVNDQDRGLISGISCSVQASGARGGSPVAALVLLLGAFALRLRRRSSRPTTWTAARPLGAPLARSARCRCTA
jgi:MYXO-CTERM domain-containing protein